MPSSPLLLLRSWKAPPTCLSWAPLGLLPMPPRPMWLGEGGPWGVEEQPGNSAGSPCPSEWGKCPPLLSCSSWRAPPAYLSWSSRPQGRWSCLASTSPPHSVPPRPTGSLGGPSHLIGHQGSPPAAGRHPSCEETLTRCLPTLPSSIVPYFFFNPIFFSEMCLNFWLRIFGVEACYSRRCGMSPSSFFRTKTCILPGAGSVGCWWVTAESFCSHCLQPRELLTQTHTPS